MLDGHETVQIACGKVRWEGAIQHASLGNGFGRAQCRAVGAAFSELLARFFQDKCHHCDCPEIVDARLVQTVPGPVKRFPKAEKWDMHGKRFVATAGFVLRETVEKVMGRG